MKAFPAAAVYATVFSLSALASPYVLPNGAVMTPNGEVGRDRPVATDVSMLISSESDPNVAVTNGELWVRGERVDTGSTDPEAVAAVVDSSFAGGTNLVNAAVAAVASRSDSWDRMGAARTLPPYLHLFEFDSTYPEDADWYCDRIDGIGYCSSVRRGGEYARNYDWRYDRSVTAVVKVPAAEGRFASVGVASVGTNLTEEIVTGGKWSRFYRCLPGMMLDGINGNGVVASINVVAKNGSEWETEGTRELNVLRSVRWILDTATAASNAAAYVAANAYVPQSVQRLGYSVHLMVADGDETWVVEDGVASNVTARAAQVMTNFRLLSDDDPYGSGYERYGILTNAASSITNAWYTNAYRPDADGVYPWPTEFAAPDVGTHVQTNALQLWAREHITPNLPPKRDGKWWQTVHTSVYDLTNRVLRIAVQETDDWYVFRVPDDPDSAIAGYDRTNLVARFADTLREAKDYADSLPPYVPKADDPAFSNAVLSVGIDTNALAAVAASTNAVAQIGEFCSAFSGIGITPAQGGMTLAGLLAALVAAVTWLKRNKISLSGDGAEMTGYLGLLKTHGIEVCDEHAAPMNIAFSGGRHSFTVSAGGFAFRSMSGEGFSSELSPDGTPIATMGMVGSVIGDVNAVLEAALNGSEVA